jgi:hypothetical protein
MSEYYNVKRLKELREKEEELYNEKLDLIDKRESTAKVNMQIQEIEFEICRIKTPRTKLKSDCLEEQHLMNEWVSKKNINN